MSFESERCGHMEQRLPAWLQSAVAMQELRKNTKRCLLLPVRDAAERCARARSLPEAAQGACMM